MSDAGLRRTPLHVLHAELGARFTPFAGWEMPLQYAEGLKAEHLWTRAHAGLFDVSHMGQIVARGDGLQGALEAALPVDFEDWPDGLQRYTLLLNDAGGIDDDLMVTRAGEAVAIVVNAGCRDADMARLRALCPRISFEWNDAALLALQGPAAEAALAALNPGVVALRFMHAGTFELCGAACFLSRSGYTGEDGYEISVPAGVAGQLARTLLANPEVKLVGLAARDTLRLEAGLHLYGQDMNATTTVHAASLGWAIAKSRRAGGAKSGGFPGATKTHAEAATGPSRRLVALEGVDAVPVRHGAPIVDGEGGEAGAVTSGTVSPTLGRPVMLASLDANVAAEAPLFAVVRGKRHALRRAALPFVPKRYQR